MAVGHPAPLGLLLFAVSCPLCAEETVLAEVKVRASATADETRRNASASKLVFEREELEKLDAATIADLLRKLPGTGAIPDPDSRRGRGKGRDKHMPEILVDGQPLPGGDRSPGTALRLPVELIERVEIIRNSTAEFKVGGPGGVINLVLRDVPPRSVRSFRTGVGVQDGEAIVRLEGQYGERDDDFGYLFNGSLQSQPLVGQQKTDIQRFAGGVRNEWTKERISDSGRDNNLSLLPRFTWTLGDGAQFTLSPFINLTDSWRNTLVERARYADPVTGSGLAAAGQDHEREAGRRGSGRLTAEWRQRDLAGSEWSARASVQGEFEEKDKSVAKFAAGGAGTGRTDEETRRNEREASLQLKGKHLIGDAHLLTGAVEWREKRASDEQQKRNNGVVQADGAGSRADIADGKQVIWLQDEWQLTDSHVLTPGLRWERQQSEVTDGLGQTVRSDYSGLEPSLHALWQVTSQWNLRASMALDGKPPGAKELSPVVRTASGVNTAANPDKAGNPNLKVEHQRSLEIGTEYFLPERAGSIGFSLFYRHVADHIQKLVQLEGTNYVERPYNVGDAVLRGGLADFKWRLDALGLPDLTLRGNASYTATRLSDPVPGLGAGEGPRKSANLGFDYEVPAWRLTFGGNYNYVGPLERESSATVRQSQGARRQLDLNALYRLDRQFSLRLSAYNVTRETRSAGLQEFDTNGDLSRLESDSERGLASVFLALEAKW
jgi:iron complex outermembrane receptor protein